MQVVLVTIVEIGYSIGEVQIQPYLILDAISIQIGQERFVEKEAFNLGYIQEIYLDFRHLEMGQLPNSYILFINYY